MDFIEQWFGVSPDGGDGSLEILYAVAVVIVVAAVVALLLVIRQVRRSRTKRFMSGGTCALPTRRVSDEKRSK